MEEQPASSSLEAHGSQEMLPDSSPEKLNQTSSVAPRVVRQQFMHAGPLPPPEMLAGYEKVLPGSPERILRMAEKQEEHRHSIEKIVISGNVRAQHLAVIFAFAIALSGIGGGTAIALHGHALGGFSAVLATLASLVSVFFYGRHEQRKEREAAESRDQP